MPDDRIKFSQLSAVLTINTSDIIPGATENGASDTGYSNIKFTIAQLAAKINEAITFSGLETESKYIVPAINEIKELISSIPQFDIQVVQTLPTTGVSGTVYLLPAPDGSSPNMYEEYLWINNSWEKLGSASVDLSNYYNKNQINGMLADVFSTSESYNVGDIVIYNNYLYVCIGATSGAWDSSKWSLVKLSYIIPKDLEDLDNVNIQNPTHRQGLVYDNPTGEWVNGEISSVGSLNDLTDVSLSTPDDGDSLVYNETDEEWQNKKITRTLTQSEYNALTPSEKNNGTIYLISDTNISADEVDYSSGVSVADELDLKANIADLSTVATTGSYNDLSNKPVIDSSLSSSSTNAVQNKVINSALGDKANSVDSWLLSGGVQIPANSDLNTYSTTGNYVVVDNSVAATLSNLPVQEAGTLKVFRLIGTNARYICQVYMSFADSKFYKRYSNNQGDTWKPWNTITTSDMFDTSLSSSSTNAVQNKVVKTAVDAKANKADVFLLSGGIAITNNTDLNSITTAGSYYIAGDSIMPTIQNAPSSNSGKLEVASSLGTGGNYVRQTYTDWKTKQFVRYTTNAGTTWTAWESVINGTGSGIVTVTGMVVAGFVTGSGNYVSCTIPLLNTATSATIAEVGSITAYFVDGAVQNAVQLEQSSVTSINHHGITCEFRLRAAGTANRVCSLYIAGALKFTLS